MTNEKIYVFSYGEEQLPIFYEQLFKKDLVKHEAVLNGFIKCVDDSQMLLVKKDRASSIKGTVFEVTRDELFMLDRWKLFPQYGRFRANVLLVKTNEILENVFIYTKLEFGKYYALPEDMQDLQNPSANQDNINAFARYEKMVENFPLFDFAFLFKCSKDEYKYFDEQRFPYATFSAMLNDKEGNVSTAGIKIPTIITAVEFNKEHYLSITIFATKIDLNAIQFAQLYKDSKMSVNLEPIVAELNLTFFDKKTPDYFLSHTISKTIDDTQVGLYENCLEVLTKEFELDPWDRFNLMLNAFIDFHSQKKI
ncbi:Uncharacterised protein [Metamycoplasma arthritidis]|uniref:Gamma-glutamylcyclotransferase AIG2-like domain-containing protein n=1 Tax=Metamycoplasma arthritidis (strain 158L3-1) TaxID=243272 RepID=B3PN42_META1|nr:hypothetical protein [Metamycoplasma arthritidis]ACF07444.1 hypothetical protein MARTH_orf677 [Metamycoplasma arthritidis 158L3-1]VEU78965.1 Uncharacterised protein [Metamycoplasma arthritidis]